MDTLLAHSNAAMDLMAMTCGDITRFGGLPAVFWNVLDVQSLGSPDSKKFNLFVSMLKGLVEAANKQGIVVHKGETAELGQCVGTTNPSPNAPFNWAGIAFGLFLEDKIIYGDRIQPGDIVIALGEKSFRSNGLSDVRKALALHYGPDYLILKEAYEDLVAATIPSVLYDRFLATANGWFEPDLQSLVDIRLISHITGGGINKFVEALAPTGLSARLNDLYELPMIMRKCATWLGMTSKDLYGVWNGGQGVILVIAPEDVIKFLNMAKSFGIGARICGEIFDSKTTSVEVLSKYDNEIITFHHNGFCAT
jgi:phosphoribosylformylglycinamidine cyclo-ligase